MDNAGVDEPLELPAPGDVVWATTLGPATSTRCRIEGHQSTVSFEYSRVPSSGSRRVHLVRELDRTDTLSLQPELGRLVPADEPDDFPVR